MFYLVRDARSKMIVNGLFLFLLGVNIGNSLEENANTPQTTKEPPISPSSDFELVFPNSGPTYFVPQEAKLLFSTSFSTVSGAISLPPPPEKIEVIEEQIIFPKPHGRTENPPYTNPIKENNDNKGNRNQILPLPLTNQPGLMQPSTPFLNSPATTYNAQFVSGAGKGPGQYSNQFAVSEVDVVIQEVPPPPPVLLFKVEEIFQPYIVEERRKNVVLVPLFRKSK